MGEKRQPHRYHSLQHHTQILASYFGCEERSRRDCWQRWIPATITLQSQVELSQTKSSMLHSFQIMLMIFRDALNFKIELKHPSDGKWGKMLQNGSWNGMVGMLVNGETDMVTCGLTQTHQGQSSIIRSLHFCPPILVQSDISDDNLIGLNWTQHIFREVK